MTNKVMIDEEQGVLVPVYKEGNRWVRRTAWEEDKKNSYVTTFLVEVHPALVLDKEIAEERYPEYCI